jgi:hypothetical protein
LNLHVHFHLLAVDAVFEKLGEGVRIHEAPPPAKTDVAEVPPYFPLVRYHGVFGARSSW